MTKLKPMNGNVILKIEAEKENKTQGGIILTTTDDSKLEAVVVAVAPDATTEIAEGNKVVYKKYAGTEIEFNGEKYLMIKFDDILAKYIDADEI
jgi:chaperonin GroES